MPGKILLIADSHALGGLRAGAELPGAWLKHAGEEDLLAAVEREAPWLLPVRPELLVESADPAALRQVDRRTREELLHALRGNIVCYLAVLTRDSFRPSSPRDDGPAAPPGKTDAMVNPVETPFSRTLAEHAAWYRRFRAGLGAAAGAHRGQLHHVLILVCCDSPPAGELGDFNALVHGAPDNPLFDVSYVMMEHLESGGAAGQVFHAEHVWPIAVGDLLLKLLHDRPAPASDAGRVYAWRSYLLAPDVARQQREAICRERFASLREQLLSGSESEPAWDSTPFTRFDPVGQSSDPGEPPRPTDSIVVDWLSWLDYPAKQEVARVVDRRRWAHPLVVAARKFGILRSRRVLESDPPAAQESTKIWRLARQHPRYIGAAQADPTLLEGPVLGEQYEVISGRWEAIRQKDHEHRQMVDDAEGCAEEYESARHAFLTLGWRLVVVLIVTLFVGYLAMAALHPLLGNWQQAAAVAVVAALGSATAALFGLEREHAAGQRGQESIEGQLADIDHNVQQRHDSCIRAVESADIFWQQMRARAAAQRLQALLQRVQSILDRELQYRGEDEAEPETAAGALAAGLPEERLAQRRRQRERYRRATRLVQLIDIADLGDVAEESLGEVVHGWTGDYLDEVWHPLCEQYDKACAGNLPASVLIPDTRDFCDRFEAALLAAVRQLAFRRMTQWDYEPWVDRVRSIVQQQQYFELMSCRVLSFETADPVQRPHARLYLRQSFDDQRFMTALASGRLAQPVLSPWLETLPLAGLLFQETPVVFHCDKDVVCVGPYRRARDES